jgi:hypothetical protein
MKPNNNTHMDFDDSLYSEEDLKKSEEFKEKGNVYFKG